MESIVKCCVCNEMEEPIQTMPCLHSGCLQCLETYSEVTPGWSSWYHFPLNHHLGSRYSEFLFLIREVSSREIKCPKCHGTFQVPLKGVEDLPTNYFTASAVSSANASAKIDPNNIRCEMCEENEATVKCSNCNQFFCDTCQKMHLKIKAMANHQFFTIDEAMKGGSTSSAPRILHCQKHPHLEINSYCKTDQTAVCAECAIDLHKGHDVDRLVNISQGFKNAISTLVNKVSFIFHLSSFFFFFYFFFFI